MDIVTRAMEMGTADPAEEIMQDVLRYLPGIQINGIDVLWIAYQHIGKTASGLTLPASFQKESGIQGQVGLIVKRGPMIDKREDLVEHFDGSIPQVGQWAMIDTRYGIKFILGGGRGKEGRYARIIEAKLIYAIIERPDWVI